jgi:hypothetical protein
MFRYQTHSITAAKKKLFFLSFCLVLGSAVPVNKKVAPFQLAYSGYIQTYDNFQGFISPWLPSGNLT